MSLLKKLFPGDCQFVTVRGEKCTSMMVSQCGECGIDLCEHHGHVKAWGNAQERRVRYCADCLQDLQEQRDA